MAQPIQMVAPTRAYLTPFAPTPIMAPVVVRPEPVFVAEPTDTRTLLIGGLVVAGLIVAAAIG